MREPSADAERADNRWRRFLVRLFLLSAAVQIGVVLIVHLFVPHPTFPDAQNYDASARVIANVWQHSGRPSLDKIKTLAGTDTWGMYGVFASVYRFFGPHWLWAKLALAIVSATTPVSLAIIGRQFLPDDRSARVAGVAAVLYPTALFWPAVGLKDSFVGAIGFGLVALQVSTPGVISVVIAILGSLVLFAFRPVFAGATLISTILRRRAGASSRRSRSVYALTAVVLGLLLVIPVGARLADRVSEKDAPGVPAALRQSVPEQAKAAFTPYAMVRGGLGPFPWAWDEASASPYRWMYPGMVIWIALLPTAIPGLLRETRDSPGARQVAVLLLIYFAAYYFTYTDGFFRQRAAVETAAILFSVAYWARQPRRAALYTSAWMCLVVLFALVQSRSVTPAVGTVVVLVTAVVAVFHYGVPKAVIRRLSPTS